jgi:hypothetical protein
MTNPKSKEYLVSIKSISNMLFNKAKDTNDKKLHFISLMIFNYLKGELYYQKIDYSSIELQDCINLVPLYEYMAANNIELYDLKKINIDDVNTNKQADVERFVLSHIFYMFGK